ncbi:hypothetical protein [Azospirillum soli]|uniref:hypothetical protein n=1 Tax=Azospirillum soli TaxID=1304799 RepID=UPI001AE8CCD2|nr:hypothetical protein [Azospirillum soli]MBP2315333.1 hypothetical protein [Azospirillum soli]
MDSLSSQGLLNALFTGLAVAEAADGTLTGCTHAAGSTLLRLTPSRTSPGIVADTVAVRRDERHPTRSLRAVNFHDMEEERRMGVHQEPSYSSMYLLAAAALKIL